MGGAWWWGGPVCLLGGPNVSLMRLPCHLVTCPQRVSVCLTCPWHVSVSFSPVSVSPCSVSVTRHRCVPMSHVTGMSPVCRCVHDVSMSPCPMFLTCHMPDMSPCHPVVSLTCHMSPTCPCVTLSHVPDVSCVIPCPCPHVSCVPDVSLCHAILCPMSLTCSMSLCYPIPCPWRVPCP